MTAYAVVETALARLHGADAEAQRGAFRGRLKHLQRLGLPLGEKPGKGKRIDYSDDQIWQLAVALEFSEFGIDPTTIVELLSTQWEHVFRPWFIDQSDKRLYQTPLLLVNVALMSSSWRPPGESMKGLVSIRWVDRVHTSEWITSDANIRVMVLDVPRMHKHLKKYMHELQGG